MTLGLKELKNINVYYQNHEQPFARVFGVVVDADTKKIIAYKVKTLSIIPISQYITADRILWTDKRKMVLKNISPYSGTPKTEILNSIEIADTRRMICKHNYRIRDVRFDFEIGEMANIIMSKTLFSSKIRVDAKDVLLNRRNKNV